MPSGLILPSALGMYTRRTASGRYVLSFSDWCSSITSASGPPGEFSIISIVTPSTPALPPFLATWAQAALSTSCL
jgi:hypothetical protein